MHWKVLHKPVELAPIKGGVEIKHLCAGWSSSCFSARGEGAEYVLTARTRCSVAGQYGPAVWVFSTSGFHRFFATKPVSSETNKAERGRLVSTMVLSGTRGP